MYGSTGTLREPAVMCFGGCGDANVRTTVLVRRLLSPSLNSCGDSLGLELLHYLLYAAACYVSRANDTSASVKRSVGLTLTGTPASWVSPSNILL